MALHIAIGNKMSGAILLRLFEANPDAVKEKTPVHIVCAPKSIA